MNINISEEAGVRYLHFGSGWVQGAMRIARPFALELDYTKEMMLPLLLHPDDWPQRVLLVGLGAGSLCKFLWRYRPEARLTVVEIEPRVEAAARQFFKLPDDPRRIRLHFADGADFMIQSKQRYDLILVDGFDSNARAGRLDSLPFYLDCKAHLADDGLLCANLLARRKNFSHSIKQIEAAFDDHVIVVPSRDEGNAIAVASANQSNAVSPAPIFTELQAAAQHLRQATHLNLLPMLANLAASGHFKDGMLQF
ncbi:spermidine synthase [Rugosibacter aromaticivorans]|uniref:Spermidine synthase n=1 Tax=Rugosibacter aromaticivorans TaxID=1565605 RepID=A0A0C5JAE0_9PROT|nr:fused MFS/spermidine synthase [Rugosibacter aromaticivorans]AJP48900.1 spermidine synthase [Rugosibacter aromaticivorans]